MGKGAANNPSRLFLFVYNALLKNERDTFERIY